MTEKSFSNHAGCWIPHQAVKTLDSVAGIMFFVEVGVGGWGKYTPFLLRELAVPEY